MKIRLIEDVQELKGTCYFEFLIGPYQGKHWSRDSAYLEEDVFNLIEDVFSRRLNNYDHFAPTEASASEIEAIAKDLDAIWLKLDSCKDVDELSKLLHIQDRSILLNDMEINASISQLKILLSGLTVWLRRNVSARGVITILGL